MKRYFQTPTRWESLTNLMPIPILIFAWTHTPGLCFFWSCQTFGQTTKYCHNYSHIPKKFHNVLAMPKTQKTCIVGTTPPIKSNPMACGLGWGHGHIVQWQCFACCMTCGMPMGACCGSHFGPNGGGGKPQNLKIQR